MMPDRNVSRDILIKNNLLVKIFKEIFIEISIEITAEIFMEKSGQLPFP